MYMDIHGHQVTVQWIESLDRTRIELAADSAIMLWQIPVDGRPRGTSDVDMDRHEMMKLHNVRVSWLIWFV